MAAVKRDGNHIPVWLGVASETIEVGGVQYTAGVTPIQLTVDPTTKRLRVKVAGYSGNNGVAAANAKRDANHMAIKMGLLSDESDTNTIQIETVNNGIIMQGA